MGAKIRIEHNSAGWVEVFKSPGMQAVVDQAGQRIAAEAGEHFHYHPRYSRYTVVGHVSSDAYTGAYLEAVYKVLTKAVHK